MKKNYALWLLIPLLTTVFQVCMKAVAIAMQGENFSLHWLARAAENPFWWLAIASEVAAFSVWIKILATHDLSKAFPISAISYVFILASGWFVFQEAISWFQLLAAILIMAGAWLIGTETGNTRQQE